MNDEDKGPGAQRLYQMDANNQNLEYRVSLLESEQLPKRVQQVEFIAGQLQGEVTAVKEIARGIGVKVDSGIQEIKTINDVRFQELKAENIKNQSFIRGVVWCGTGAIALIAIGPVLGEIVLRLLGSK